MSFEQKLRDQIKHEAGTVPLPERDPERAVGRARTRRYRRQAGAASLAAAIAVAVVAPPMLSDSNDPASVTIPGASGLVPTGPLDLDWQSADGGLSSELSAFQSDDGTFYALSTGPGARYEDYPDGDLPRALYRLTDDGTWEPLALDGDRPRATDVSGGDGLLYAVSTGPAGGGEGSAANLSTSDDGGETWTTEQIEPVDPPSDAVDWETGSVMAVETSASTTLALVTTRSYPDVHQLFPELADLEESQDVGVETQDDGLALVRYLESPPARTGEDPAFDPGAGADPEVASPEPDAPSDDEAAVAEAEDRAAAELEERGLAADGDEAPPERVEPEGVETEMIDSVPWSELGVDGPEALVPSHQLFRHVDGGWEPVEGGADAFAGLSGVELTVAGDQFVATGWADDGASSSVLTSADGTSWSPVSAPSSGDFGQVVGVGPALVEVPWEGTVFQVSGDAGATWSAVDLADAGVAQGSTVLAADGGPLGLAVVLGDEEGTPRELAVTGDLADWTVTPVADVVGSSDIVYATPDVGEDRIVLTASLPSGGSERSSTVTAVGTPVRNP
jgi:hypothetical protein